MFEYGPTACTRCWDGDGRVLEANGFRLVRDAGYWGRGDPDTLVLGISKGNTQANAVGRDHFESIAFKGIRDRLLSVLQSVGLANSMSASDFESEFTPSARNFGFASVVRCSLTGWSEGSGKYSAESNCVTPAFRPRSNGHMFVKNCIDTHLVDLPLRTKQVVLLGNSPAYVKAMKGAIATARGAADELNEVAYLSNGIVFTHVTHPSRLNGHFGKYIRGEGNTGRKRDLARAALARKPIEN
tara:strand:- start:2848 stop:3573 length:726 start_codon:yes stop_codon:yes gene_type:complete